MSTFVYLLAEGVHDVAFLGKLLVLCHKASRLRTMDALGDDQRRWMESFTWPLRGGKKIDIERLSVPAPVFYKTERGEVVALRNAQGISSVGATLTRDREFFARNQGGPSTIGVVLDSDDEPQADRFRGLTETLRDLGLTPPDALGACSRGDPRVGVLALPAPGEQGTLEDVLLALGDAVYPALRAAAKRYVDPFREDDPSAGLSGADRREIKKPAGLKKATIAAMTAVLKPGKSTQTSLEDNRWISEETRAVGPLQPSIAFLDLLLSAGAPKEETS